MSMLLRIGKSHQVALVGLLSVLAWLVAGWPQAVNAQTESGSTAGQHAQPSDSQEQMWQLLNALREQNRQQQAQIEKLQQRLEEQERRVSEAEAISKKPEETPRDKVKTIAGHHDDGHHGHHKTVADSSSRVSIGGYGELHYNRLRDENDQVGGDDELNRVDFHRFVLFFGHEFTDRVRLSAELELEHAHVGEDEHGAVELGQAYIEADLSQNHRLRAGVDILPIGILNRLHEPETYYGVERNGIETEIIPTAWAEAGLGLNGRVAPGWHYDAILHGGLGVNTSGEEILRPRSGLKKTSEAEDQDIALTGRLRYRGMPGLELALAGQYQADITGTADDYDVGATLLVPHLDYRHHSGLGLRVLYARWDYDVPTGLDFKQDSLDGWYVEPAYRLRLDDSLGALGMFVRYGQWDAWGGEGSDVPDGEFVGYKSWNFGFNWWPVDGVVFKFDYQKGSGDSRADTIQSGVNLGLGYHF